MTKNIKVLKILITAIFILSLSFMLIFNGCTNKGSDTINTAAQEDSFSDNSELAEESSNETVAAENKNKETENIKEQTSNDDSSQGSQNSEVQDNSLKGIYNRFIASGKPSILVFSYDADCCPTTKAFFEEYNAKVINLMKSYSGVFNTVFINIGILDKANMNTVTELAVKHGVLNLPSILLLDSLGNTYKVIDGEFKDSDLKEILDGLIND